jgi:hypothetical protein
MLQDHGCTVYFRNVWLRPLPSRWDNTVHSAMSADENDVMKLRRETAGRLFAGIADPSAPTADNVQALAEVVSYAMEGGQKEAWEKAVAGYLAAVSAKSDAELKASAGELVKVRNSLRVLERNGLIPHRFALLQRLEAFSVKFGWK